MATTPARATITTVAARAGVSRQTVSNVLNSPGIVQSETRRRVETAIAELDYRPNLAARQMRTSRSQAVAVRILPTADGVNAVVMDRFVHALCSAAERYGYHLLVFTATDDSSEIAMYEQLQSTVAVDGFVVVGTHAEDRRVAWLSAHDVPFVAFGRPWSESADHCWVDVDGAAGTEQATRFLLASGHRRIAFLGWDDSVGVGDDREAGWRRALAAAGEDANPVVLRGADSMTTGARLAGALAVRHPDVTAAVCVSDSIAIGALQHDVILGRELALVGFDNTATAQTLGLTSVAQPLEETAAACLELLHALLSGPESRPATSGGRSREPPPGSAASFPGSGPTHVLLEPTLEIRTKQIGRTAELPPFTVEPEEGTS